MSGIPWDQPGADPLADIAKAWAQAYKPVFDYVADQHAQLAALLDGNAEQIERINTRLKESVWTS